MNHKYLKAIECLAEIIVEQENELKYRKYEIDNLKEKIKKFELEVSNRKEIVWKINFKKKICFS